MITEFLNYQSQVKGLAPRTCEEYGKSLAAFVIWASPRRLRWSTITKQEIDNYTRSMTDAKLSASTIKSRISALRCFYDYLVHEGKLQCNPAKWCQTPKRPESIPQPANLAKIDEYLATPATSRSDALMHMMTALLLETGMRISEALNVRASDFNQDERSITIFGKGNKQRKVFYGSRSIAQIRKYCHAGTRYLFDGLSDVQARFLMYETLGRYCPGIHPHQLRHTFGCMMVNNGMPLTSLATLMGHNDIHTTEIYARATANKAGADYKQIIN